MLVVISHQISYMGTGVQFILLFSKLERYIGLRSVAVYTKVTEIRMLIRKVQGSTEKSNGRRSVEPARRPVAQILCCMDDFGQTLWGSLDLIRIARALANSTLSDRSAAQFYAGVYRADIFIIIPSSQIKSSNSPPLALSLSAYKI